MKCRQVYRFICENIDQDLDSPRCREIKRHLNQCTNCTAYFDTLKKTVVFYRKTTPPKVPPSVHRQLFRSLDLAWLGRNSKTRLSKERRPNR